MDTYYHEQKALQIKKTKEELAEDIQTIENLLRNIRNKPYIKHQTEIQTKLIDAKLWIAEALIRL